MEKKIKFGCVAWGLPGGGYFGPQNIRLLFLMM